MSGQKNININAYSPLYVVLSQLFILSRKVGQVCISIFFLPLLEFKVSKSGRGLKFVIHSNPLLTFTRRAFQAPSLPIPFHWPP